MIQSLNIRLRYLIPLLLLALLVLSACARISKPEGWSAGLVVDDTLFVGTREGRLLALDRFTGETRWAFDLRGEETLRAIYSAPTFADNTLFVGGYDGILYALSTDGELLWEERVEGPIVGSPTVADGTVLVGSTDGDVYAFDIAEGLLEWRFSTENAVWSSPAVSNGVAYFGSLDHDVYAVNLDDSSLLWQFPTKGAITASPVVADGRVYIGSFDGVFYAINARTGQEVWRFVEASNWYWGRAVVYEDTIYAPSLDGNLYALDIDTGKLRWTIETEGPIVGSPAIVFDMIAVASEDGKVRLARLGDGLEMGSCNIGEQIRTPLASEDGFVYFGAKDNSIRALEIKRESGNPDEAWVHFTNRDDPIPRTRAGAC
jgi:outer membrane protein assembly factor BamB